MRLSICHILATIVTVTPIAVNAEQDVLKYKIPTIVKNIAEGAERGAAAETAKQELHSFSLGLANSKLNLLEDKILSETGFTHLELSLGSDVFGLDSGTKTKSEVMAVYWLHETSNLFLFNQTSIVNFDSRRTFNIGLGARHITDDETLILGANAFYDYETKSGHKRSSLGFELLTAMLEFRANTYNAISGTIAYNGINETALDGRDMKLTANLPYLYSSNVYYSSGKWKDGLGYETKTKEFGITAEVLPNLFVNVAQQKKDSTKAKTVASISYSIPIGNAAKTKRVMQDGNWDSRMKPIREKLYKPVQRENRIMKKAIKLGVTVSGY
ncbi:inverse autotransporter beta domain-containing protein [Planktomarina temperata]|nr:inverse autotransporter beta domain-containing protein [Planktomarina temperata]